MRFFPVEDRLGDLRTIRNGFLRTGFEDGEGACDIRVLQAGFEIQVAGEACCVGSGKGVACADGIDRGYLLGGDFEVSFYAESQGRVRAPCDYEVADGMGFSYRMEIGHAFSENAFRLPLVDDEGMDGMLSPWK